MNRYEAPRVESRIAVTDPLINGFNRVSVVSPTWSSAPVAQGTETPEPGSTA